MVSGRVRQGKRRKGTSRSGIGTIGGSGAAMYESVWLFPAAFSKHVIEARVVGIVGSRLSPGLHKLALSAMTCSFLLKKSQRDIADA